MFKIEPLPVLGVSIALSLLAGGPAAADPVALGAPTLGYTYFNRPGADRAQHDSDLSACMSEASRVVSQDSRAAHQNGARGVGLVGDLLIAMMTQGTRPAAIENCMVVRGWRVIRLPDQEGRTLATLSPAQLGDAITPWIGAEQAHGDMVRVWSNDAIRASTDRYALRPSATPRGSLSVLSMGAAQIAATSSDAPDLISARDANAASLPSQLGDQAVIIFHIKGISSRNGVGMSFARIVDEGQSTVMASDGRVNSLLAWGHGLTTGSDGVWRAFVVPPGRWRMAGLHALFLCLGAPAFEVGSGEVVYGGTFDLSAEDLGPDLSLEPVQSWLQGQPNLARSVRAAQYTNGWTAQCGGSEIYALEINGAPFRAGYAWGSQAQQQH